MILADRAYGLGHDLARDRRYPRAIAAIDHEAVVEDAVALAVDDRRAGRETRQDRQQKPNRRVQPRELLVAGERQIDLQALEVRPAVALAREDAVERVVNDASAVRPELDVVRVHPRVHRRRHEPQALAAELVIREPYVVGERLAEARERRPRPVALELDDVQRELVVPRDVAVRELVGQLAGGRLEELVGGRRHVEALAVDEHVLDLEAVGREQAERPFGRRRLSWRV